MTNQSRRLRRATLLTASAFLSMTALAGCHHADPLIGNWSSTLPIGTQMSAQWDMDFKADGTETQNINAPGQSVTIQATYTTKDGSLTQTLVSATRNGQSMPAGKTTTMNFKLEGDTLTLTPVNSSTPLIFHRQKS